MEFGLIAPVAILMLIGTADAGHNYYARTVLDGAMQEAARDSSLEGAAVQVQQDIIDKKIAESVKTVAPGAVITPVRRYYKTFSAAAAAKAEEWTDTPTDLDGICNNGEPYIDANNNEQWDADGGTGGQGGAQDVVIIKVNVTYKRLFPMAKFLGFPEYVTISSNSILANQPYGDQAKFGPAQQRNCT
ncbi:TadE/TadG family type IV pilus assembly protein [Sphingorhabdus arenilitoris]|uniref:TadE/TadG family type IV pilus assembly protein n=1 Tax=Sphingorhabdus arenilitoris TaxID=1490041 RepID=A0ABV8RIJ6_9SPHN